MKNLTVAFLFLTFCATAFAADKVSQLQKAANVLNEIMQTPDKGIPDELLEKAVCVGIVPSELKFAFGVGGTYGRGVLVCRKGGTERGVLPPCLRSAPGAWDSRLGARLPTSSSL